MYKLFIKKCSDSKLFLREILNKYHINDDIIYNEYGKPYIKGNPLYFNISHAKPYIVIAISSKEIGVDMEYITYKKSVLNKYFNKKEIDLIKNEYDFTKRWVMKESFIKSMGVGLSYGLINVDTTSIKFKIKKYKNYYIAAHIK